MSACRRVEKRFQRGKDHEGGQSSMMARSEVEQTLVGDAFPDSTTLPEHAATEACLKHPLQEHLDDSRLTSPTFSRTVSRNPTPRPQLFPSLEAARDHVYRKSSDTRQSSRNASGEVSQAPSEDEMSLGDMNPLPSACVLDRSVTAHAQSQSPAPPTHTVDPSHSFSPITRPVIWEDVPKPLNTSCSRNVSSSQMSGSSVENIVGQYGQLASATQGQAVGYGDSCSSTGGPILIGHGRYGEPLSAGKQSYRGDVAAPTVEGEDYLLEPKVYDPSVPAKAPTSRAPLHPSNPFFNDANVVTKEDDKSESQSRLCSAEPDALPREAPTPLIDHHRRKYGSDLDAGSATDSSTVSVAESKVGPLSRPSNAMHSVRRQRRGRQSSVHDNTYSAGVVSECTDASDADEDPFKYDRGGPFLQASKERIVSARLRMVSGLPRESTATVYSQDGTPSRTFYGEDPADYFGTDGQPLSPESTGPQSDLYMTQAQSRNPFAGLQRDHYRSANVTNGFYDPDAINPEWASGKPDTVRVPVTKKDNRFGRTQRGYGVGSSSRPDQEEVGLEALRRHEGDNLITGNTED